MSDAKPVVRLADVPLESFTHGERYADAYAAVGALLGLRHLGVSYDVIPPGKAICPFHNHYANDEFYVVLEGEGTYRFGDARYPVAAGDVMGAPAGGRDTAHHLINTGSVPLRVLVMSSMREPDVCEYPDSDKFLVMAGKSPGAEGVATFRHVGRRGDAVDYWDGE
ncbi:cupin domain-containing protein [Niveibacterium umoris]|uniref:Putative cupin superfamily protein n=1 Tax=Niveibacterium umoris TaxID=1193620 RepID=A0A840BQZ5_9RHOO|nr:cupin domain-containing protein [Niveibacterium umoris]MBB4013958.1 putative cupin superfamily protein [Niveibacterium umoris]